MRVLVTGASGLLGANLALEATKDHTVFGLTHSRPLHTSAFTPVQGDLLEEGVIERLLDEIQPEWVIHCAALANVDACETDPELAFQLNSLVPAKLAKNVARGGARLVYISTDAVFDGLRGGYSEKDNPNPLSVYARTKLEGERLAAEANSEVLIARVNLFGWSPSGRRSLSEFFFYNLQAGKRVQGFTDVYFCPLLANDLAHLLLQMLGAGLKGLYHAVSRDCLNKYDFGIALARQFGLDEGLIQPASVEESGLKAARSPRLTLRSEKLAGDLGQPNPSYMTGLERLYALHQQGYPAALKQLVSNQP